MKILIGVIILILIALVKGYFETRNMTKKEKEEYEKMCAFIEGWY